MLTENSDHWFHNLDKIIHYVNYNASKGGPVVAFYSTPSHYVDAKFAATKAASAKWEVRHDDIFPLGDAAHNCKTRARNHNHPRLLSNSCLREVF
jgi:hypothetical protein